MARREQVSHGRSNTRIYRVWHGMLARCQTPSSSPYRYYGGRGIKVCQEWQNPLAFFEWADANGYSDELELDRIDPDGDYEPENCQFISHVRNSQKRRNARCTAEQAQVVKVRLSEGFSVAKSAEEAGVPYMTAWHISKGNTWR